MKSPFKFLDSYTKDDREIFFGREREIEELYHRVFESKIMLVYGVSGTGKSSLIHCGLANKFQDTDWLPLVIRRGGNIIESVAAAIKTASITAQQTKLENPSDFKKGVRSLYLDHYKPVFFIFDQFEELFIFGGKEERKSFVQIVKSLYESELQCRMIFVMREEYMAGVTEFEKYISTFFSNRVRIEKMSHINALEAIKGPCKIANINLEDGFAEALLEKLSPEETDVELTYLQVFLDKVYRLSSGFLPPPEGELKGGSSPTSELKGGVSFTLHLLSKTGNVSDLLGSFVEEQLKELDEPDTGLTILKSFVSIKGTKKQLSQGEVIESSRAFGKDIPAEKVTDLLLKFVNLRILRDKDENGKYELRHDSLATKIYEKITIVEKEMMEIYQFLENALISYQKRKVLLNANDLKYLTPYEDRLFVNKETTNLIELSKKELNKGKKRIKRAAIAGFVAILIISLGTIGKIFDLPLSNWTRQLGYVIYIVWFLPLFIFYVLKTRENRTVNVLFLIFTLFFLSYIYMYRTALLSGLTPMLKKSTKQSERQVNYLAENIDNKIDSIYNLIDKTAIQSINSSFTIRRTAENLRIRTDEIVIYIQDLKIMLVSLVEGKETKAINDRKINFNEIQKIDDANVSAAFFIGANSDGKAFQLKDSLNAYKELVYVISDNNPTIVRNMDKLLNLNDIKNTDPGKQDRPERWENNIFQIKNLGFTLLTLSQFQLDIKYCESEVMSYLYNKMLVDLKETSNIKRNSTSK